MASWKERAQAAEQKLKDLGHSVGDKAKRTLDMGKAKVGIDAEAPLKDQITEPLGRAVDGTKRAIDMGKAKGAELLDRGAAALDQGAAGARRAIDEGLTRGGANLDEPLMPQIGGAVGGVLDKAAGPVGRGIDAVGDAVTKTIPGAVAGGMDKAGDLKNLFLDKVLGTSGGQPPYMYQGAPPAPPSGASMYDQGTPPAPPPDYMYNNPNPAMTVGPTSANPQPWLNEQPPQPPPHMYQGSTPDTPQSMYNAPDQGRMQNALRAAEEAFNRVMGR